MDSQSLKTASARLDSIRKEVSEAFATKEDASTPAEPDSFQKIVEDAPAVESNPDPQP